MWDRRVPEGPGGPPTPTAEAATSAARGEPSILVVDGNAEIREVIAVALTADGYRVEGCGSGRDALNHLRSHPEVCVILLDVMLPMMAAAQFRAAQLRDRSLAWIPVIVMSGAVDAARDAERIGARALVRKPVDLDQLRTTLRHVGCLRNPLHIEERRSTS